MTSVAILVCSAVILARPPQPQTLGPNDTFAAARLTADEVREIVAGVERSAYDTPESWMAELRVKRLDLGADPGIVVQGTKMLCGATGNCQAFVFRKAHGHWESLFGQDQAPTGESFQFGPGLSNGIKDFTVLTNISANAAERVTYAFDGRVYKRRNADPPPRVRASVVQLPTSPSDMS